MNAAQKKGRSERSSSKSKSRKGRRIAKKVLAFILSETFANFLVNLLRRGS